MTGKKLEKPKTRKPVAKKLDNGMPSKKDIEAKKRLRKGDGYI